MSCKVALWEVVILTRVVAPARLHFGLFNESGIDGKIDGGAGMAVSFPSCDLTVGEGVPHVSASCQLSPDMRKTLSRVIAKFRTSFGLPDFWVMLRQSIPEHVGLGSKTACLMALGQAIVQHFSLGIDYMDLARFVGRGGTSGVGVHVSKAGGIVVDAGHTFPNEKRTFAPSSSSLAPPPPLVEASSAPAGCQIVHFRLEGQGISGDLERDFFVRQCPIPEQETYRLLEVVDSQLLPGIRDGSLLEINRALSSIQELGLKAREWSIQGAATKALCLKWREGKFSERFPLCLSSMGPTTFVLTEEPEFVQEVLIKYGVPAQSISITHPWSGGYLIENS